METSKRCKPTAGAVLILAVVVLASQHAPRVFGADISDEKLKALIADLGNDDFEKRTQAEKELSSAGVAAQKALEAVKDSTDQQVKKSVNHLLGRLKYLALPEINYLDLLPQKSMLVIRATSFATLAQNSRKTALGRMIDSPALAPFKARLTEQLDKNQDLKKTLTDWDSRFNGQAAAAVIELDTGKRDGIKMAVMAEITDPDPEAVFNDLVTQLKLSENADKGDYNDVSYLRRKGDEGALALVGKHVVLTNNLATLKQVIDSFLAPGKFSASESYTRIKPSLGENPDVQVLVEVDAIIKTIAQMPLPFPVPLDDITSTLRIKNVKLFAMSSSANGDSFEDRLITVQNGTPDAAATATIPPPDVAPINAAALAPQSSVAFAAAYLDGSKVYTALQESLPAMNKLKDDATDPGTPQKPGLEEQIKQFETKFGVKVSDIGAAVKGEVALWVVPSFGLEPAPPDICTVITCADADKAAFLSETMGKVIAGLNDKPVIVDADYKNRKIHQLDMKTIQPNEKAVYAPAWVVDSNHLFIGSSTNVLQKLLSAIDGKAPGLALQADFMKALGTLKPEERKGSFLYVDLRSLLVTGASVAVPLLQMQSNDEELKKALAGLPDFTELFKDVPPILGSVLVEGEQSKVIVRAAVPPIPTAMAVLIGIGIFNNRDMLMQLLSK